MAKRRFFQTYPTLSKRSKFVLSTVLLSVGMLVVFLLGPEYEQLSIGLLVFLACLLTLFSLRTDLAGKKWSIVILLPMLYTLAVGLFYYLLPERWLTRLIMLVIFAIGFYALLLAENIFVVSTFRNIKLLHAARTIGFLLSVVCAFGLYNVLFSLHTYFPIIIGGLFVISVLLITPVIWSMSLKDALGKREVVHTFVLALSLTEIGTILTFWPVNVTLGAVFLAGNFYTLVGLSQHWLENRLFKRVLWEYLWVALILLIILFFTTRWGG